MDAPEQPASRTVSDSPTQVYESYAVEPRHAVLLRWIGTASASPLAGRSMAPHLAVDANTDVIATHLPTHGKSGNACARGMAAQVAAGDRLPRAPPRETTLR